MNQSSYFRTVTFTGFALATLASAISFLAGGLYWSFGVLTSACWAFLNGFFLFHLIRMGIDAKAEHGKRILLYSLIKFPVLYVAGFFILKSRFFPLASILTGLTLFFAAFALTWLRVNWGERPLKKGIS